MNCSKCVSIWGTSYTLDPLPIPHFPPLQIPGGATDAASQDLTEFLFCSSAVLDPTVGHTVDVLSPFISVILIDSSTGSPVYVLMLSIQAVRGLPGLLHLALFLASLSPGNSLVSEILPVPRVRDVTKHASINRGLASLLVNVCCLFQINK